MAAEPGPDSGEVAELRTAATALSPRQLHAARCVIAGVRAAVRADLVQASLFGSRARGDAGPDSDVDILLVFRHLPEDREPYASEAENIAAGLSARQRVPVNVWSVSLIDLALGNRTPMLVDALADALPLWCPGRPLPPIPFTPHDSLGCVAALLRRVDEGSREVATHLVDPRGLAAAARRSRDDIVRLCSADLLLSGVTRPRRAEAVRAYVEREDPPPSVRVIFRWAERSFGIDGKDEDSRVDPPPGGIGAAAFVIEGLRRGVIRRAARLRSRVDRPPRA